jgi:hypothetical protein
LNKSSYQDALEFSRLGGISDMALYKGYNHMIPNPRGVVSAHLGAPVVFSLVALGHIVVVVILYVNLEELTLLIQLTTM